MDIFDVLTTISKRKISKRKMEFMHAGMKENEALIKAEFEISKEYHILLHEIKKLGRTLGRTVKQSFNRSELPGSG